MNLCDIILKQAEVLPFKIVGAISTGQDLTSKLTKTCVSKYSVDFNKIVNFIWNLIKSLKREMKKKREKSEIVWKGNHPWRRLPERFYRT